MSQGSSEQVDGMAIVHDPKLLEDLMISCDLPDIEEPDCKNDSLDSPTDVSDDRFFASQEEESRYSDVLLKIQIHAKQQKAGRQPPPFYLPLSLLFQREAEMQRTARATRLDPSKWKASRLYAMWKDQQQQKPYHEEVCLNVYPETAALPLLEWTPVATNMIRSFYQTGRVYVPYSCTGIDVVLALEYFGLVVVPDAGDASSQEMALIVFESPEALQKVQQWSMYLTQRSRFLDWMAAQVALVDDEKVKEQKKRQWVLGPSSLEEDNVFWVQGNLTPCLEPPQDDQGLKEMWNLLFGCTENEHDLDHVAHRMRKDLVHVWKTTGNMNATWHVQPVVLPKKEDNSWMPSTQVQRRWVLTLGPVDLRTQLRQKPTSLISLASSSKASAAAEQMSSPEVSHSSPSPQKSPVQQPKQKEEIDISDQDFLEQIDNAAPLKFIHLTVGGGTDAASVTSGLSASHADFDSESFTHQQTRGRSRSRHVSPAPPLSTWREEDQAETSSSGKSIQSPPPPIRTSSVVPFDEISAARPKSVSPQSQSLSARAERTTAGSPGIAAIVPELTTDYESEDDNEDDRIQLEFSHRNPSPSPLSHQSSKLRDKSAKEEDKQLPLTFFDEFLGQICDVTGLQGKKQRVVVSSKEWKQMQKENCLNDFHNLHNVDEQQPWMETVKSVGTQLSSGVDQLFAMVLADDVDGESVILRGSPPTHVETRPRRSEEHPRPRRVGQYRRQSRQDSMGTNTRGGGEELVSRRRRSGLPPRPNQESTERNMMRMKPLSSNNGELPDGDFYSEASSNVSSLTMSIKHKDESRGRSRRKFYGASVRM